MMNKFTIIIPIFNETESIFKLIDDQCFSLNVLWDLLIANRNLEANVSNSTIVHIGDINALNQFNNE